MSSVCSCLSDELDAFWSTAVTVVETGDFDTYASMYHPDAVLVQCNDRSQAKGTARPITQALEDWKTGFDATKSGEQTVKLAFRFRQRISGAITAHETGIFCYECTATNSKSSPHKVLLHFESLLIKKPDRGWLWMMEYQKHAATQEEWDALDPSNKDGEAS